VDKEPARRQAKVSLTIVPGARISGRAARGPATYDPGPGDDGLRSSLFLQESPVAADLEATQVYGWQLRPATGRVLLQADAGTKTIVPKENPPASPS